MSTTVPPASGSGFRTALRRSPYDGEIKRLALPALGALAVEPLVSLVDLAYVGRLGTSSLGALAVAAAVLGVAFAGFNFLSYGTTPLVAVAIGRGDDEGAGRVAATAVVAASVLGVVAMFVLLAFPHPLLQAVGAGADLLDPATTYLRIRAAALPALLFITASHGIFRGLQDTRTTFVIALGLNLVNLVLDPVLIFGFDMGLAGAAWGTVAAQWMGALTFGVALAGAGRRLGVSGARPGAVEAAALGSAGGRLILRTGALLAILTASTAVVARIGTVSLAAHQVALQMFLFFSLALDAIAIAAQAMLGKAIGVADRTVVRAQADRLVVLGTAGGAVIGLGLLVSAPFLPNVFTDDPAVIDQLQVLLPILALVELIGGAVFAWDGIVIGATDFSYALAATAVPALVSGALLALGVPLGVSLAGVWWILVMLMVLRAVMLGHWHTSRLGGTPQPAE